MRRFFYIIVFLTFLSSFIFAQQDTSRSSDGRKPYQKKPDNIDWRDRFYWGGNVAASFGSYTFVDLSPLVGIKVTKQFSIGVGAIYNYYSYTTYGIKHQTNLYGGRVYGRWYAFTDLLPKNEAVPFLNSIFLQVGWDKINRNNPYSNDPDSRVWIDNILVGGGLRYPVTDRLYCVATGLWNLNQSPLSPYQNPIVQIGFVGSF